ncbi:phage major capsid protein [Microbacterium sp. NPDC089320]|uniref:phage major capsid protein n=1 Tax=Microbacterium sp. NPDC089320 TaxID=3155182 RepID=UPI00341E2E3E
MNLTEKLKALLAEVDTLSKKGTDLTEEDVARVPVLRGEIDAIQAKIKAQDLAASTLKSAIDEADGKRAKGAPDAHQFLSRADRADGFAAAFKTQLAEQTSNKALVPNQTVTIDYSAPLVAEPRPALTLLSLVSYDDSEAEPTGAYLRQTLRENNATTVAAGAKKPTSRYGTESVPWELSTIAHLSEPIRKQFLEDFAQLNPWLAVELAYGVTEALQDLLLDGGVSEGGATVRGLDTVVGTNTQAFVGDTFRTLRLAIGALEVKGIAATGIALNPTDWTEIELSEDNEGRPLTTAFAGQGMSRSLWGVPVVVSPQIEAGTSWVGDWRTILLKRKGTLKLEMTDKGVYEQPAVDPEAEPTLLDLYEHNLLRARAEVRAVFQFLQPAALTKVDISA